MNRKLILNLIFLLFVGSIAFTVIILFAKKSEPNSCMLEELKTYKKINLEDLDIIIFDNCEYYLIEHNNTNLIIHKEKCTNGIHK